MFLQQEIGVTAGWAISLWACVTLHIWCNFSQARWIIIHLEMTHFLVRQRQTTEGLNTMSFWAWSPKIKAGTWHKISFRPVFWKILRLWGKQERCSSSVSFLLTGSGEADTSEQELITCRGCWAGGCCQSISSADSPAAVLCSPSAFGAVA